MIRICVYCNQEMGPDGFILDVTDSSGQVDQLSMKTDFAASIVVTEIMEQYL